MKTDGSLAVAAEAKAFEKLEMIQNVGQIYYYMTLKIATYKSMR